MKNFKIILLLLFIICTLFSCTSPENTAREQLKVHVENNLKELPDQLIGNLGDVHLYKNHVEQAIEQTKREPYPLPDMKLTSNHNFRAAMKGKMDEIYIDDFILLGYQSHPTIKAPLSN